MAASSFPATPVTIYNTTWSYNPKDHKTRKFFIVGVSVGSEVTLQLVVAGLIR
jgi:hypothetical protein